MTLLLYAVTDRRWVSGHGVGDAPLSLIRSGNLAAVVSEDRIPEATEDTVWEYERAVESLMDAGAVLPARFRTVLEHEGAARALLREQRDAFVDGLQRVRGAVEMGVRVQWADAAANTAGGDSGTAYMLAQLALVRSARGIAERLAPLLGLARVSKVAVMPRRGVAVLASYLIEHGRADEFAERCARLTDELAPAELACTGPWPPYSFVRGGEG